MARVKFSVITPCYNARNYLEDTIASVLAQSVFKDGRHDLQYIIVDGGSQDGTREFLAALNDPRITWISERDRGMYDALVKGFGQADGQVHSYINAGDMYFPWAFEVVADAFEDPSVHWLTGLTTLANESGQIYWVDKARRYWSLLIRKGAYGRYLPFIQQESTFWRAPLWQSVDVEKLRAMKLVGDYYIWVCFARQHVLHAVNSVLAAFRIHAGQLSENKDRYHADMAQACDGTMGWTDRLGALADKLMSLMPLKLLDRLGYNDDTIVFDSARQQWRRKAGQ